MATETYDEIKRKTLQWCQSLLNNKIYSQDQYNKCVGSFVNLGVGQLPNNMTPPPNGNEFEYSLYDRQASFGSTGIIPTDTNNKIMLATNNGLFLTSDDAGVVSANAPNSVADQQTLRWSLVKQGSTAYAIMSTKYNFFLGCDSNGRVSANRTDISNSTIWNITAVNNYINLESAQFQGQFLTADSTVHITIASGESQNWQITVIPKPSESLIVPFDATPLLARKANAIYAMNQLLIQKYQLLAEFDLVDSIITETTRIYNNIVDIVDSNITNINTTYNEFIKDLKRKYNKPSDTINSLSTAEREKLASYTDNNVIDTLIPDIIPRPPSCVKTDSNAPCNFAQVVLIQSAQTQRIAKLTTIKNSINDQINKTTAKIQEIDTQLSTFSVELNKLIANSQIKINNNNLELTNQASAIENIQKDNLQLDASKKSLETSAEQAIENQTIANSYYSANKNVLYVYYGIIVVSILLTIYMSFKFIKKIM
jgi:hypothetical protein